jgi:hypothetical protein
LFPSTKFVIANLVTAGPTPTAGIRVEAAPSRAADRTWMPLGQMPSYIFGWLAVRRSKQILRWIGNSGLVVSALDFVADCSNDVGTAAG